MWISRHRLERMDDQIRQLQSEINNLKWACFVRSDYSSGSLDPDDPRISVPLRDIVMRLADHLGVCVEVINQKAPEARVFKKGGPEETRS